MAVGDLRIRYTTMKSITCKCLLSTIAVAMFCTNTVMSMSAQQVASKKPHVILIVADDLGWNDVSWNNPNVVMPYMNELAMNGVILNQSYLQPTCTPTRSALLTGKYPFKLGLQRGVIGSAEPRGVPIHVDFLPKLLKKINYETHAIGKWHLGFCSWDYTPTKRGFDTFYGFYTAATDYYTHKRATSLKPNVTNSRRDHNEGFLDLRNNTTPDDTKDGIYSTHLFGSVAEEIVRSRNPQDPLFMYLAFQSVHSPIQVPQHYAQIYKHISNEERRNYLGMVTSMDWEIGRLVRALKETGHYNNSIIIFTTDNGGSVKNGGSNWPLRGEKASLWEGGVRGPAFIHSPYLPNPGTVTNQLHHATDWFRTIVDITGGTTEEVDGISQWDALAGVSEPPRVKMIYNMHQTGEFKAGVRFDNYKMLIGCIEKNSWSSSPPSADSPTNPDRNWPWKSYTDISLARNNNNNNELPRMGTDSNDTSGSFNYSFDDRLNNFFSTFSCIEEYDIAEAEGKRINWKHLKNHSDIEWDAEVLWVLGQHINESSQLRLYNIKEDPEERNNVAAENIHELQRMLNYLSTQIPYMIPIPERTKVKAGHPLHWNNVWSPGWCQSE